MRTLTTILLCLITLVAAPLAMAADGPDEGYFLSLEQKGQLIWDGRIQDGRGDWYDVLGRSRLCRPEPHRPRGAA